LYTRRLITVLVVDIRDFTPLTRQLDESVLAQLIGTWFRESGLIVRRYGCSGDKYIGDAVMAVWTHTTEAPKPDEMRRVLQALADLQTLTSGLHQQFPLPAPLRIGAGINTGLSVMGNTGAQDNPEFSPLGDSVNAAFRLETATKGSGLDLALGKATFECFSSTGDPQQFFEKRVVQLKGYDHGVEAWLASFASLEAYLRNSA
jgi:adenylate cyclase